ncbi:MAG: hypothetical protein KAT68_09955 [Bacteroidales bacterium]|nr:hypothetical protein [Bacteroidales bacterium]
MKKILSIIISLTFTIISYSQNEMDVLQYSQTHFGGTARAIGLGGAFGALGGDLSTLSYNPAGIAIYRGCEFSITPTLFHNSTDATYFDSKYSDSKYNFNFNNIGYVGTIKLNDFVNNTDDTKLGWKNINFAIGYNRLNNFNKNILIEGVNNNSSIVDYFLENVDSSTVNKYIQDDVIYADLIYADSLTASGYTSDFEGSSHGQTQSKSIRTRGAMGEYFISLGANYGHVLYIGGTIGIQKVEFEHNSNHQETDPSDKIPAFVSMNLYEHWETWGTGCNFKFGMIYRPIDWIRIGGAIHTPTFFYLEDDYSEELEATIDYTDGGLYTSQYKTSGYFKYEITTPYKAIGSIAFIYKKIGLISVDYEFIDYSIARLSSDDYSNSEINETISDVNKRISSRYTSVGNIRVGAELKNGPFRIRGGYAIYNSPYSSSEENKSSTYYTYSGGFGISDKSFYFDIAYVYSTSSKKYFLYELEQADLESQTSKILATFGIRF